MRKSILLATTLLAPSLPALAAPPRMDTLAVVSPSDNGVARACASDQLCVDIAPSQPGCEGQACTIDVGLLQLPGGPRDAVPAAQTAYRMAGVPIAGDSVSMAPWPQLIRFEGGVLAGVLVQERSMYSGGGASATTLHLIAFVPGQPPFEVLGVPHSGSATIRACFSERHMKQRAGACHDEYSFDASLALTGESAAGGMPVLRYRSKATSFPGPVSRSKDSLAARPLRQRDLVTVTDPQCSYQRLYRFAPQARAYVPETPVPDCSNYTVP
ncbi:hypothetical protein [Acidovorax sp. A1169]|uniref:hypothetical protein n=1 Tax=Acidovorax sp. A1169 TaxID=3059524 RepID=UPI002737F69B|nr:hypothetical protein [Acidovorax sp. A1169]MDP4073701.1 hypothetical protein [Acidovorax sp. A1169]